jgi:hypothetical protein
MLKFILVALFVIGFILGVFHKKLRRKLIIRQARKYHENVKDCLLQILWGYDPWQNVARTDRAEALFKWRLPKQLWKEKVSATMTMNRLKYIDQHGYGLQIPYELREQLMRRSIIQQPCSTYMEAKLFWGKNIPSDLLLLIVWGSRFDFWEMLSDQLPMPPDVIEQRASETASDCNLEGLQLIYGKDSVPEHHLRACMEASERGFDEATAVDCCLLLQDWAHAEALLETIRADAELGRLYRAWREHQKASVT